MPAPQRLQNVLELVRPCPNLLRKTKETDSVQGEIHFRAVSQVRPCAAFPATLEQLFDVSSVHVCPKLLPSKRLHRLANQRADQLEKAHSSVHQRGKVQMILAAREPRLSPSEKAVKHRNLLKRPTPSHTGGCGVPEAVEVPIRPGGGHRRIRSAAPVISARRPRSTRAPAEGAHPWPPEAKSRWRKGDNLLPSFPTQFAPRREDLRPLPPRLFDQFQQLQPRLATCVLNIIVKMQLRPVRLVLILRR